MKRTEIRLGTKCKVSKAKDATIYTVVKWIDSWRVELEYKTTEGRTVNGGVMDISLLVKA